MWLTGQSSGELEEKRVEEVFVNETNEIVHVRYGDTEIDATPTHPFYTPDRGWVKAVDLRAGDRLQLVNGEYVTVEQVQHEILESPVKVYNFEVQDNHTYYVGGDDDDSAVLVHNKCPKYEKAPYHNKGNGRKSPAPSDGQKALDNSFPVKSETTTRRVGVSNGQFVVFDQTTPGVFHGHVRHWSELSDAMKNALRKAGLVTRKGKIIK